MYKFDFELTLKDWLKFQISHSFSNIYLHIVIILALLPSFIGVSQNSLLIKILTLFLMYIWLGIFTLVLQVIVCLLKKDYMFLTQQSIIFSRQDILSESKYGNSQIFWNNKTKIKPRLGNVLVYISTNYAILIPKRAFENDTQRQEFIAFCKKQIANSTLN